MPAVCGPDFCADGAGTSVPCRCRTVPAARRSSKPGCAVRRRSRDVLRTCRRLVGRWLKSLCPVRDRRHAVGARHDLKREAAMDDSHSVVLDRSGLAMLVAALTSEGYRVVGPTVRDGAIVLAELSTADDLPAGWGVETGPGRYRLRPRADGALFGHSAGPQSWKQFLHPPRRVLMTESDGELTAPAEQDPPPRYAFLGVRGCDLAAIAKLDTVLAGGAHPDGSYARRRRGVFVVAANCTEPGGVCFCASMGCGPDAGPGYDLALTESVDERGHRFLVDVGTPAGQDVIDAVRHT